MATCPYLREASPPFHEDRLVSLLQVSLERGLDYWNTWVSLSVGHCHASLVDRTHQYVLAEELDTVGTLRGAALHSQGVSATNCASAALLLHTCPVGRSWTDGIEMTPLPLAGWVGSQHGTWKPELLCECCGSAYR